MVERPQAILVEFARAPAAVVDVRDRLDPSRARAVAARLRDARAQHQRLQALLRQRGRTVRFGGWVSRKIPGGERAMRRGLAALDEVLRRYPRGKVLWVTLREGAPPARLPELDKVGRLNNVPAATWARFLRNHGLPEVRPSWIVDRSAQGAERLLRVPLDDLHEIAWKAHVLAAAEKAAVFGAHDAGALRAFRGLAASTGHIQPFSRWLQRRAGHPLLGRAGWETAEDSMEEARRIIALALEEALGQLEARNTAGSDRGIPGKWAFSASGFWPLLVVQEFVHRDRVMRAKQCVICGGVLPPRRRLYCGRRHYELAKKRRWLKSPAGHAWLEKRRAASRARRLAGSGVNVAQRGTT